jgi:uncharacterized membrane protein YfhO
LEQTARPENGIFDSQVQARRPAVVLLKATFDPRWTATVDGTRVKPAMMAPSLVGVDVPRGRHQIRFRYEPYSHYALLLTIGALTLLALVVVPRRHAILQRVTRLRKSPAREPAEGAAVDRGPA